VHELASRPAFTRDFRLRDQIEDASGSVMHNIAEGHDAGTDPEFVRFLKMARRSAGEVQSELYLALDRKYIAPDELQSTYFLADEAKRLVNGLIAYLRKSQSVTPSNTRVREQAELYVVDNNEPDDGRLSD
jgi:four helix bundle protein